MKTYQQTRFTLTGADLYEIVRKYVPQVAAIRVEEDGESGYMATGDFIGFPRLVAVDGSGNPIVSNEVDEGDITAMVPVWVMAHLAEHGYQYVFFNLEWEYLMPYRGAVIPDDDVEIIDGILGG